MHTLESLSVYVYVTAGELVGGIRARNVGQEKKKRRIHVASIRNFMDSYANIVHTEERQTKKQAKRDGVNVV